MVPLFLLREVHLLGLQRARLRGGTAGACVELRRGDIASGGAATCTTAAASSLRQCIAAGAGEQRGREQRGHFHSHVWLSFSPNADQRQIAPLVPISAAREP